ncbi:NmrA family transcriptional regulator [Mycolicibacterium madagascariense]|uniref:NmrA family transcriptional regulator n=1 Tax=Mycolicibacterium madagascariense TaxID=212765 RepID=A0A7I7XKS7_9MYCO|nr:NAD(P)H-binding protein [Mycolicibacterium madagascariense]MCV7012202.1 NAD(P)H-binding protein [Mycolicibacterium madagascariense]BBZ29712.1 NmrA family transcriptional regulator [Mycolicibacterium madagascariense]
MSDGSKPTVLVIGAGGHGGTGARVVEQLLAHDRDVRLFLRSRGAHVDRLVEQGVQVVIGDLMDRRTLVEAVRGVDAVYFAYPIAAGAVPAAANLASALRSEGVSPHLVVMSMGPSAAGSPSALGRAQWVAEEIFTWAGFEPTILRVAALFYENVLVLHGHEIRQTGRFANSFGTGPAPWISGRDAADLAVAALVDPDRFADAKVSYPPGSTLLSHVEVAEVISAETGRAVEFEPVSQRDWQARLEATANDSPGVVNTAMAQHISAVGAMAASRAGAAIMPNPQWLEGIIGHPPVSFADFVREHREEFTPLQA